MVSNNQINSVSSPYEHKLGQVSDSFTLTPYKVSERRYP